MKNFGNVILLSVLILVLASCSSIAPKPTETPVPTETSLPTLTSTPEPTNTPTKTSAAPPTEKPTALVLPTPSGKPSSEWEGIPIMPNAIAGEGDSTGYSFTINAETEEIQNYYEKELGKLGWNMFASGQGTTDAVFLIFMKGAGTLSVSIIPQTDGIMYVLLVNSMQL